MLSLIQILVALTTKGDALIVVEAWVLSLSKMQGDMLNLFARLMPWMPHFCGPVYNWQINYFSFNIDHPTYTWSIYALIQTSLGNKLILYTLYFIHLNVDILSLVWSLMGCSLSNRYGYEYWHLPTISDPFPYELCNRLIINTIKFIILYTNNQTIIHLI